MDDKDFCLEDVIAFGGGKEDFEMLQDLDSLTTKKKSATDDNFNEEEFKEFFGTLNFRKKKSLTTQNKKEKEKSSKKIKEGNKEKEPVDKKPQIEELVSKKSTKSSKKTEKPLKKKQTKLRTKSPLQENVVSSSSDEKDKKNSEQSVNQQLIDVKSEDDFTKYCPLPNHPVVKSSEIWFDAFSDDPPGLVDSKQSYVKQLKVYAMALLDNEVKLFKEKSLKNKSSGHGNVEWMKTVVTAGTLSDRISALTLLLQQDPVHNLHGLETLITMSKKKGKREAIMAIKSVKDLMINDLIPNNRRLKFFHHHPLDVLLHSIESKDAKAEWSRQSCQLRLILWAFEHRLKQLISTYVELLETLSHDMLEAAKSKAMSISMELLSSKPEQEKALLTLLVNKLGDPKYKLASKALHMLNRVISEHPLMQGIVVHEVRDLLLRPNIAARAQYYCVCFLSSQILSHERKDVAQKLIQIYMSLFKARVNKKELDNKMLSALLTGVNRAFPYATITNQEIVEELDILFRTVHIANLSTAVRSLVLLFQVFSSRGEISDRFYNALYSSLFHVELPVCTIRHPMLLNLLYRALKSDTSEPRVQSFVKRILQVSSMQKPPFCAAAMVLISELIRARPSLAYKFFTSSSSADATAQTQNEKDGNSTLAWLHEDADEEEHFVDVKNESDVEESESQELGIKPSSWMHKHQDSVKQSTSHQYDPLHRNPQYSKADTTPMWELHSFVRHFHPTVALYAKDLINTNAVQHTGDPLDDHTLFKFLDRFVYRNPKDKNNAKSKKGTPYHLISIHMRKRNATFNNSVPVNSSEFLAKKNYLPEEMFFLKYFSSRAEVKTKTLKRKVEDEDDIESVSDDEFDRFMNSSEGQYQLDKELNFSDHVYKNRKHDAKNVAIDDDDDDGDDDGSDAYLDDEDTEGGYGFDMEDGEEDMLADAGTFITDDDFKKSKSRDKFVGGGKAKRLKRSGDEFSTDKFNMMLENTAGDKYDSISSSAVLNKDRSSAKQLQWEKKQHIRDVLAKKREWRKKNPGYNKTRGKREGFKSNAGKSKNKPNNKSKR